MFTLVFVVGFVLGLVGVVLYLSRNADLEGENYYKALKAQETGAVMIADDIDYTDPALIERDQ